MTDKAVRVVLQLDGKQYTAELKTAEQRHQAWSASVTSAADRAGAAMEGMNARSSKALAGSSTAGDAAAAAVNRQAAQFTQAAGRMEVSAKQTQMAVRMLPAQFTDIVTSLSSGMPAWQVAIQQGGQIKDSFGGAGAAAKGLASYVGGLVNPFTVATAAVGVLGLAYYQGSKEADGYRHAIVMSGNAAGTTLGQLTGMAQAISEVTGTQGAAAQALAQMAGSGAIASENLQHFTEVAMGLEKYVGVPVKAVVGDLEQLGKAPLQASIKLNEQYHYLTEAVYTQIKALDEQGRKEEAGAVAQRAYMAAMETRKNELVANLGTIERAWIGVTGAAKKGWDAILGVGRATTDEQNLAQLRENLTRQQERNANLGIKDGQATANLKEEIRLLEHKIAMQGANAQAVADQARQTEALAEWDKVVTSNLSKQAKEAKEIENIRQKGLAAGRDQAAIEKEIAAYKAKNADKGGSGKELQNSYRAFLTGLNEKLAAQQQELETNQELSASDKLRITWTEALGGKLKGLTDAERQAVETKLQALAAGEHAQVQREGEFKLAQQIAAARQQEVAGIDAWVKAQKEADRRTLEGLKERQQALRDEEEAARLSAAQNISLAEAIERVAIKRLEEAQAAKFHQGSEGWEAIQKEIDARKELAGLIGGKEAREAAKKTAEEASRELQRVTEQYENGLTNAAMQGGKSLKEYITGMLRATAFRILLQPIMAPLAGLLAGVTSGGAGGGGGSGALGMASNAYGLYNMGSQAWTLGSQYLGGTMSGANALGTMWANGTGGGLDALLATNGAYGTAGGGAGAGMSGLAGAGVFAAVAAVVLNALGAFRSERRVGSGIRGTLGKGSITPWEEWREGGTLFDGPSFETHDPLAELERRRARLAELRAAGQGSSQQALIEQSIIDNLEAQYGDLAETSAAQSKAIQSAYDTLRKSVGDMADVLGLGSAAVRAFTTELGGAGDKGLNFDGLSDEQIAAKIAEALATANNELAQQVIGTWVTTTDKVVRVVSENTGSQGEDRSDVYSEVESNVTTTRYVASEYAREGEKAIDTLTRLATSLSSVNAMFGELGVTLLEASLSGGDAASALADAFGGLERMAALSNSFYQTYFSEEERRAALQEKMNAEFEKLGIAVPKSRDEFRKLVTDTLSQVEVQRAARASLSKNINAAIAGAQDSGFSLANAGARGVLDGINPALLGNAAADPALAGKLNGFLEGVANLADKGLDPAAFEEGLSGLIAVNAEVLGIGKDASATAAALMGLSDTFAELNDSAEEIAEKQRDATDKAFAALQTAVQRERDLAQEALEAAEDRASAGRTLVESLRAEVDDIRGTVASTAGLAAAQGVETVNQALAAVRAGVAPQSLDVDLPAAAAAARSALDTGNFRSRTEFEVASLTWANRLEELGDAADKQLTTDEQLVIAAQDQIDGLDKLLDQAKMALEVARGTYTGIQDLNATVKAFYDAVAAEMEADSGSGSDSGAAGGGSSGPVFGPGGSGNAGSATKAKYNTPVYLGTAGVGYQPITDPERIAHLDKLAPTFHKYDGTNDLAGLARDIKAQGGTAKDLAALYGFYEADVNAALDNAGIPRFDGGGMHAGGARWVGETAAELEITGPSRILSNRQLGELLRDDGGTASVVAAVQALQTTVYDLVRPLILNSTKTESLMRKFDALGLGARA